MERELFAWEDWDDMGDALIFYDCRLTTDIPGYPKGTEVDTISIDYDEGEMELFFTGSSKPERTFSLGLFIKEAC